MVQRKKSAESTGTKKQAKRVNKPTASTILYKFPADFEFKPIKKAA
jgi:hypothetical protein